jgi:hypothetical protein
MLYMYLTMEIKLEIQNITLFTQVSYVMRQRLAH